MKLLLTILILISMKSYGQDFYVEMPDCFCLPFPIESKPQIAINEFNSYIDTCEINKTLVTEVSNELNRCDNIANHHYRTQNGSNQINKYIKTIHLTSKYNLFELTGNEISGNKSISEISDNYLEIKNKLLDIEKYIGHINFQFVSSNFYVINFENHISLEFINETFSEYFEIEYSYLAYVLTDVNEPTKKIMSTKGNKIIFHHKVEKIRIIDFLGSYSELEFRSEIDISSYQRGVYILQFTYENEIYNYKFIKE